MVDYLTVGGEQYPVRISYRTLKQLSTLSGELGGYERTERIFLLALQNGAKVENKDASIFTQDWLEERIDSEPKILGEFVEIMDHQMGDLMGKITGEKVGKGGMLSMLSNNGGLEPSASESTT